MVIVIQCCNGHVIVSCEHGIVDIIELHDHLLLGSKKGIKNSHVFLKIIVDARSYWHRGRGSPNLDITKKDQAKSIIIDPD